MGARCRVSGPKSVASLLHMFKNAERNAELMGLDVDSLVFEYKAPKMWLRTSILR